jgi:PAS domain S-box-containing protein
VDARTPIYSWVELAQAFAHGSGRAELCRPVLQRILSSASASDGAIYAVDPSDASLSQVVATGILEASHRSRSRAVMRVTDAARESRCALHLSRAQLDELDLEGTAFQFARWVQVIPLEVGGHHLAVLVLVGTRPEPEPRLRLERIEAELGLLSLIFVHDAVASPRASSACEVDREDIRVSALHAFQHLIPQALLVKDLENRVLFANRAAGEFHRLDPKQMEGEFLWEIDPLNAAAAYRSDLAVAETGEVLRGSVEEQIGFNGESVWLRADRAPVFDAMGRVIAVVTAIEDLSDEMRARRRLEQSRSDAARAERRRDQYLVARAEEVQTPLLQVTQRLAEMRDQLAGPADLDEILAVQQHALTSIQDLLDFSRVENGNLAVQSSDFVLEELLSEVLDVCQHGAARRGIALASRAAPQCPHRVAGDAERIRQILIQLVAEAMKVAQGSEVFLTVAPVPDSDSLRLRFEVRAPSAILQPQELEEYFLSYRRDALVEGEHDSSHDLRLSLARALTHLLSGDVEVEIAGDRSFCCRCDIPVRSPLDLAAVDSGPLPRAGARVLLCEPNENMRAIHVRLLRDLELVVDAASSVDLAREMVAAAATSGWPFDAVLVEHRGDESARELVAALDEVRSGRLVFMRDSVRETLPEGTRCLRLPWRQNELCDLLGELCGTRDEEPAPELPSEMIAAGRFDFLVVDDQPLRANVTAFALRRVGGRVVVARSREEALERLGSTRFDLVLVDEEWLDAGHRDFVAQVRRCDGTTRRTRVAVGVNEMRTATAERLVALGYDGCVAKPLDTDALFRILAGAGLIASGV